MSWASVMRYECNKCKYDMTSVYWQTAVSKSTRKEIYCSECQNLLVKSYRSESGTGVSLHLIGLDCIETNPVRIEHARQEALLREERRQEELKHLQRVAKSSTAAQTAYKLICELLDKLEIEEGSHIDYNLVLQTAQEIDRNIENSPNTAF